NKQSKLHYIPTRRSSDLKTIDFILFNVKMERDAETILKALKKYQPYKGEKESTIAKQLGYDVHRFENELNRLEQDVQALTMALQDRKSTRLNSSHGSISY